VQVGAIVKAGGLEYDVKGERYYEKIQTFALIEVLLEPILTFLTDGPEEHQNREGP
jgi:hypothetical protein